MTTRVAKPTATDPEGARRNMLRYFRKLLGPESVKEYSGKYVAIHDNKVVASGNSPDEVIQEAKKNGLKGKVLVDHIPG